MKKDPMLNPSHARRGFTLTELLIALALTSLLLLGISRIFSLTSQTIGTGQALSTAVRAQRAIQQQLSADILGVGQNLAKPDLNSGMVPLGQQDGQPVPMLTIASYRVAAYATEAEARADVNAPTSAENDDITKFAERSEKIRSLDLNNDGDDTDPGEEIPLFQYGRRNWRVDALGFFIRGDLASQTGTTVTTGNTNVDFSVAKNEIHSEYGYVWYGHLSVYNGTLSRIPWQNAFGCPGATQTMNSTAQPAITPVGRLPNRNNQYANQFLLGRYQTLMVPKTDHDANPATPETVVAPDLRPVAFLDRSWTESTEQSTVRSPLSFSAEARVFNAVAGTNYKLSQEDALLSPSYNSSPPPLQAENCRVDVAGVTMQEYADRLKFLQTKVLNNNDSRRDTWWDPLFVHFEDRYRINPYPAQPFDPRKMSQRSQLLSPGVTQFMVEFAGDFVTQNADGVVILNSTAAQPYDFQPDGVIDFVVVNGARQTRWYGMPRDVNGDGVIAGNPSGGRPPSNSPIYESPDVIPLRDLLGGRCQIIIPDAASPANRRPFEVAVPVAKANYLALATTGFDEANNTTNVFPLTTPAASPFSNNIDPEDTAYICAWGPVEFETQTAVSAAAGAQTVRPVPQMLRVIVDVIDPDGKLSEPITQELIFPVPVAK